MAHVQLAATERTELGSSATRRLRRRGLIPGVLYQQGERSLALAFDGRELTHLLHAEGGRSQVIDLAVGGAPPRPALLKEWQTDPVRDRVLHVDLQQVDLTVEIEAPVAVVLVGSSIGVRDGGVMDQPVRTVTVRALPDDLPESIELDVSDLEIGGTLHVDALPAPPGVVIVDDPELVIASVIAPSVVEEPEAEVAEEEEEAAAAEAPAEPAEGEAPEE
jgi:large subunit ribosomal protein L25